MGSPGAAATLQLMMMVVATFALAADILFMSTAAADCPDSTVQGTIASGGFRRPEGGEDGLYMGTVEVDEEGVERHVVKYLGKPGNTTFNGSWPANVNDDVSQDSGAHCNGFALNGGEIYYAVLGIADKFGYVGNTLPGHAWWANYYGCTVAYACNFGQSPEGDVWATADQVWSDHHFISTACTTFGAGWFAHETWNVWIGRTLSTMNFCNLT